MDTLERKDWQADSQPQPHFRQELIPNGHVWPSGVVLPKHEVVLYNLYTNSMNAKVHDSATWNALFKDRSLFITACLNEAECARAQGNPMALLRRAVAAQEALWDALGDLERMFDIEDDDAACDRMADAIKSLVGNDSAERLNANHLMRFIETMADRHAAVRARVMANQPDEVQA